MRSSDFKLEKYVDLNVYPEPHAHAIGRITIEWNRAEREIERLLWLYLETDRPTARMITGIVGNQSKALLLIQLVKLKETSPEILSAIEHALKIFDICRENRNHIVHSVADSADAAHQVIFRKPRKNNPIEEHEMILDINQVRQCAKDIWHVRTYIKALAEQISLALTARQMSPQSVGDDDQLSMPIFVAPRRPDVPKKFSGMLTTVKGILKDAPA
jgi:hypothetical protein